MITGGRYRPETLYRKSRWFTSSGAVELKRVARPGDLLTHMNSYNDTRTFTAETEIFEMRIGGEYYPKVKLKRDELERVAREFARLRQDPSYDEIVIVIDDGAPGSGFGRRTLTIPEKCYRHVEECLEPYQPTPMAAQGPYR